jgi:uncharacterized protein (DUF433 family)
MSKPGTELFTPAEAAVLSRLSLKAVNNAIDKKTVAVQRTKTGRLLDQPAVIYLALERWLAADTTPEFRRRLSAVIAAEPKRLVVSIGALKVDVGKARREVMERQKELRRAERLVTVDPEIMGGSPVFRRTRVPVHQVAELLAKGETIGPLREEYPRISEEMTRLAPIYAAAHPLRGRPRKQPRHRQPPTAERHLPSADIDTWLSSSSTSV